MTDEENNQDEEPVRATQEEGGITCMICMEEWTIGGDHRLCCLKCGHLFGRLCIERWIKEKGTSSRCPTCNKPARKADLRDLWCKNIRATDISELTKLQETIEQERRKSRSDSALIFHQNLKLEFLHSELDKLKRGIIERDAKISKLESIINRFNKQISKSSTSAFVPDLECQEIADIDIDVAPKELKGTFHLAEKVVACPLGGCKSFTLCPTAAIILIAQPAPQEHRNIFAGFGLRKFSTLDTSIREFIPLHTKPIASIQLKPFGDLVITAGLDKKIRLTSTSNNTCIQSYNCDHEPSCVAWSSHRDQQFYVASGNCYVTLYDLRNTSEYIYQTSERIAKTRLLSIAAASTGDLNGLFVNDLKGSQFLEISESSTYELENIDRTLTHLTPHSLPFEGLMGTVDFHKQLNMALVSTRRTPMNQNCTHNLIQLQKVQDEEGNTKMQTKPLRTFTGEITTEQPLLSYSRILKHPTLPESVLVGASDQASQGIKLWDSSDNTEYQTIKTDKYIRDMLMFSPENSNQHVLYALNEVGLDIYRWDYA